MMTSSGSGYRVGGSLSSSNLSPLAPPFKVDKSLMKSNSTNPSANFSDVNAPSYGACFDPAPGQFWNPSSSSTSVPICVATESVVTNTNCSSSANKYGIRDSQSSTLPANAYYGSSNGVSGYDPFAYEAYPKSLLPNANEATKPYYPSYVPPPPQKDGYLSLGIGSGLNHDLISHSGSSQSSGFGSAQVDHPQAVPGNGGYKPKWDYSWSPLNESDYERLTNYARNCVSKDFNISNSSSNKSPLFVDGGNKNQPFVDVSVHPFVDGSNKNHLFGDVSNKSHLNQGACVSQDQGLHGQVSSVKDNCFDIFGGAYSLGNLGIDRQDHKSSSKCSRTQNSAFLSASRDSPHLQEPVLESVTSFCGSQRGNGSSLDGQFSQPSFYMFGSATTAGTFPTTTSNLPYGGSSSSVGSTPLAVKENPLGMDPANQSNTAVGYNYSYLLGPQMPPLLNCQSSIRIRRPASSSRTSSSCKIGEVDHKLDDKGGYEQILISPQLPHQLNSDGLNMEASDAVYSAEKHSAGSEGHNPAEDSPCWRGASSSYFSPFEHSESVASDGLLKNLDRCRALSSQDIQDKSLSLNTFDIKDISSGKLNKVTSVEGPSVSACTEHSEDCNSAKPKYHCFDLNAGDSLRFAEDCHASTVDSSMMNNPKADLDSKSSSAEKLTLEKEISSASKISEKGGNDSPVAAGNLSGSPLNVDNLANSLRLKEARIKSAIENSDSRIDVNVLLRSMMNLSEIVRCYCFSNRAELEKKHSVAIKQIINNLNASMSMVTGETVQTTEDSSPDTSLQKDFSVQMVNDAEALAASMKLARTAEDFLDNVPFEDDRNPFGDVNMTEAVKNLLSENLQEETDQQKLVYKNLWLEAEASLCVMTAKSRFIRVKTEMERARDGAKDKDNPTSSNVSANTHIAVELATEAKNSQSVGECPRLPTKQHNHLEEINIPNSQVTIFNVAENDRSRSKDARFPSLYVSRPGASGNVSDDPLTASRANDAEACVMARYQILQNRVGCPDSVGYECQQSSGEDKCPSSSYETVNVFDASGTATRADDIETSVFGGYRILKSRDDTSDYLNNEGQQLPGEENYLPDIDSTSPDKILQDSQMSNSLGVIDEREASVITRFRILQSRIERSNSMINDSASGQQASTVVVVEDETGEIGGFKQKPDIKITTFGPYPEFPEDEDVNILNVGINEQTFAPIVKANKMNSVIFEGWYDNDCSSSDWEHISRVVV